MSGRLISASAVCRPGGPSLQHEQQDRSPWPSVSRTCALRVELDALRAAEAVLRDARSPHWTHAAAAETSVPAESLRNTLPIELQLPNGRWTGRPHRYRTWPDIIGARRARVPLILGVGVHGRHVGGEGCAGRCRPDRHRRTLIAGCRRGRGSAAGSGTVSPAPTACSLRWAGPILGRSRLVGEEHHDRADHRSPWRDLRRAGDGHPDGRRLRVGDRPVRRRPEAPPKAGALPGRGGAGLHRRHAGRGVGGRQTWPAGDARFRRVRGPHRRRSHPRREPGWRVPAAVPGAVVRAR